MGSLTGLAATQLALPAPCSFAHRMLGPTVPTPPDIGSSAIPSRLYRIVVELRVDGTVEGFCNVRSASTSLQPWLKTVKVRQAYYGLISQKPISSSHIEKCGLHLDTSLVYFLL